MRFEFINPEDVLQALSENHDVIYIELDDRKASDGRYCISLRYMVYNDILDLIKEADGRCIFIKIEKNHSHDEEIIDILGL